MTGLSRKGGSSEAIMEALDSHLRACQWRSSLVGHQGQGIHNIIFFPCSLAFLSAKELEGPGGAGIAGWAHHPFPGSSPSKASE